MPASRMLGLSSTSTSDSRASKRSLRLVVKRGQCSAPGMMPASSANIWQPLHTPRAKVSGRPKKPWNCADSAGLKVIERAQPTPAPSVSP